MYINTDCSDHKFKQVGYAYLNGLIPTDLRDLFVKIMLDYKNTNQLTLESSLDTNMYKNSYGRGGIVEMEDFLKRITEELSVKFSISIKPSNTYARIYYNNSTLYKHVDRPGLDYTLSTTLFSNIKTDWPLYVIDKNGNQVSSNISTGDGLLIHGTELPHWRDPLFCNNDEYVIQLFLHWTKI